jgi:putative protease
MEIKVGIVNDFFSKVGVAAFTLEAELKIGDTIHIKGHTTDLVQQVESIQIDRISVNNAKAGDSIGIKVNDRVRKGDTVFKVIADN